MRVKGLRKQPCRRKTKPPPCGVCDGNPIAANDSLIEMSYNLVLNQDTQLYGTVVSSNVCHSHWDELGKHQIYSIEIKPHEPGFMFDFGVFWHDMLGMNCLNGKQVADRFINSQTVVLETIVKPLCSGADSSDGEFSPGQNVRVSCRYELSEPVLPPSDSSGYYQQPRIMLRFVDTDFDPEANGKEFAPEPVLDEEALKTRSFYDF